MTKPSLLIPLIDGILGVLDDDFYTIGTKNR